MARRHRRGNRRQNKFARGPQTAKGAGATGSQDEEAGEKAQASKSPHIATSYLLGLFLSAVVLIPISVIILWIAKFGPNVLHKSIVWSVYSGLIAGLILSLAAAAAITYFANRQFIDQGI